MSQTIKTQYGEKLMISASTKEQSVMINTTPELPLLHDDAKVFYLSVDQTEEMYKALRYAIKELEKSKQLNKQ